MAKFVTNVIGDICSTSASSPTLIVMLIISSTFAKIFLIFLSWISKIKALSELIDTMISSWIWGEKIILLSLSKNNWIICTPSSVSAVTMA